VRNDTIPEIALIFIQHMTLHAQPPQTPLILAVAGCSGSGKTTLARELARNLSATLLPLDLYYRDLSRFPLDERHKRNFDHPDSLESELIVEHVRTLAAGRAIERPVYDFATHSRVPAAFAQVTPSPVVIVEGILALHYESLRPLYHVSVFVDAPADLCLKRRIHRDMRERGRTEASIREQWAATAQPMAERFVLPSAAHASLTVDGAGNLDWSVEQVLALLRRERHLPRNPPHPG
jgi:uridine kinase